MTAILVVCRRCGREFEPTHEAIVAGTWRACPTCLAIDAGPHPEHCCEHPIVSGERIDRCNGWSWPTVPQLVADTMPGDGRNPHER